MNLISKHNITLTIAQTIKRVLNMGSETLILLKKDNIGRKRMLFAGHVLCLGFFRAGPTLTKLKFRATMVRPL